MTDRLDLSTPTHTGSTTRLSVAVAVVALLAVALVPLRVVALGFRPPDDARRHAAKAIADKPWSEILVLRAEATVDPHPGWHALLGWFHRAGVGSATGLVVLSVILLGFLFLATPIVVGPGPPEAWLAAALALAVVDADFFTRILLGRPFVVTMSALLAVALLWRRFTTERLPWGTWLAHVGMFALSAWIHGNWYLWVLPLACFVAAGQLRVAMRLAAAAAAGVAIGAVLTGSPLQFLVQTTLHPLWAFGSNLPTGLLVGEFRPGSAAPLLVVAAAFALLLRRLRGESIASLGRDPVFLLAVTGWALGFLVVRFRSDWGIPALLVWMASEVATSCDFQGLEPRRRILSACCLGALVVLAVTSDVGGRWSKWEDARFLPADDSRYRQWLPGAGGVLYSNAMRVFYDGFFLNPKAPWRYALGFEPTLMTTENLATYREIHERFASDESFRPWVRKMRPEDRLVIVRRSEVAPRIDQLEWFAPYRGMWIGRSRRSDKGDGGTPAPLEDPSAALSDSPATAAETRGAPGTESIAPPDAQ